MIDDFLTEYTRYRLLGVQGMTQVDDAALNRVPDGDMNSIGMIVRHVSGNLASRFTDFVTTDGEKDWRDRDREFDERQWTRAEIEQRWADGFAVVERELGALRDEQLTRQVTIREVPLTVHAALSRSIAHVAYHTGQILLLSRLYAAGPWESPSIPRGGSEQYRTNPAREKRPG
jgi:uncharacterized damage-inducible protein DinB